MMTPTYIPSYKLIATDEQDFYFGRADSSQEIDPMATQPHRHDCYILGVLLDGETVHNIDFINYEIKSPAVMFMSYDHMHMHQQQSGGAAAQPPGLPQAIAQKI
jgi:hypothetical protein